MNKNLLMLGLVFAMGMSLVVIPGVMAQTATEDAVVSGAEELTGEIVSLNTEKTSLTLKYSEEGVEGNAKTSSFYFNESTVIKSADSPIGFSDLKVGDKITINFVREDGWKKVAKTVAVKTTM